jgi:RNA polymerase sigma-70 factor (ECF subfamily)
MAEVESVLIRKAKNGDVHAFENLIEIHRKRVYNIALKMLHNQEDAYDITQEVFIRVFKSMKEFREEASFSTWIYRITKNACLDELRKRKNKATVSLDEDLETEDGAIKRQVEDCSPGPDALYESMELRDIVRTAIELLSDEHKFVIILRDLQGFSYEEIAKVLECPEGTVKSRINRARKALKEILQRRMELLDGDYVK